MRMPQTKIHAEATVTHRDILTDTHNPQANGQQRTPTGTASHPQMHTDTHLTQIHTVVTFTDIQTHDTPT